MMLYEKSKSKLIRNKKNHQADVNICNWKQLFLNGNNALSYPCFVKNFCIATKS